MNEQTVFIVDDDAAVRDSLALLLGLMGLNTRVFASAEDFLAAYDDNARGCLLLDVRMPGMSGLELHKELKQRGNRLPVIVITAHGDVATAREVLKGGALDFIEKPIDDEIMLDVINGALAFEANRRGSIDDQTRRLERLTPRERQVMDLLADGKHNREIAETLGISPRTVEVYRARMMEKLQARNLADLIKIVLDLPSPPPSNG